VGSDTLLGPEETDRFEVTAVGWWPCALLVPVGGWAPLFLVCGTGLPSHRLIFSFVGCGCLVVGEAWLLFVV
jgi:hypothetical protein